MAAGAIFFHLRVPGLVGIYMSATRCSGEKRLDVMALIDCARIERKKTEEEMERREEDKFKERRERKKQDIIIRNLLKQATKPLLSEMRARHRDEELEVWRGAHKREGEKVRQGKFAMIQSDASYSITEEETVREFDIEEKKLLRVMQQQVKEVEDALRLSKEKDDQEEEGNQEKEVQEEPDILVIKRTKDAIAEVVPECQVRILFADRHKSNKFNFVDFFLVCVLV